MKYMGALISSICVVIVLLVNLYYNTIKLDTQILEDYILESNLILEDIIKEEDLIESNKEEYMLRLMTLKREIEESNTSILVADYKKYKIKVIENLIQTLSHEQNEQRLLEETIKYNELSNEELDKLINKSFTKVTRLSISTYI